MLRIKIATYLAHDLGGLAALSDLIACADYAHRKKNRTHYAIQLDGAYLEFLVEAETILYDMIHVSKKHTFSQKGMFVLGRPAFEWDFASARVEDYFCARGIPIRESTTPWLLEGERRILVGGRETSFIEDGMSTIGGFRE